MDREFCTGVHSFPHSFPQVMDDLSSEYYLTGVKTINFLANRGEGVGKFFRGKTGVSEYVFSKWLK